MKCFYLFIDQTEDAVINLLVGSAEFNRKHIGHSLNNGHVVFGAQKIITFILRNINFIIYYLTSS